MHMDRYVRSEYIGAQNLVFGDEFPNLSFGIDRFTELLFALSNCRGQSCLSLV